ncbi:uncharacterized protein ATNIH1004_002079 [Aspergillus tanneri]|uniref:Uncharacterized protein n=1 Tax=Aspergillus tanneri TaxID=1220188 RepID=A0A5M9M3F9_9EURO|nr:uncharacterized protein ATNIH1004_002079 [Aspergillus tanneri]KAA8641278.1 hypothetical protein ATNIH1004_002079 [Aspergillus tanneri]
MAVKGPLVAATTLPFLTRDAYSPSAVRACFLLPAKLPGLDLKIYDKNADVVREHSIQGVRCDIQLMSTNLDLRPTHNGQRVLGAQKSARILAGRGRKLRRLSTSTAAAEGFEEQQGYRTSCSLSNELTYLDISKNAMVLINAISHFNDWQLPNYEAADIGTTERIALIGATVPQDCKVLPLSSHWLTTFDHLRSPQPPGSPIHCFHRRASAQANIVL